MRGIAIVGALLFAGCSSIIGLKEPSLEEGEMPIDATPMDSAIDMPMTPSCPTTCAFGCMPDGTCRPGKLWVYLSAGAFTGAGLNGPNMTRAFTDQVCRTTAANNFPSRGCAPDRAHAILNASVSDIIGAMKATYGIPSNTEVLRAEDGATVTGSWENLIGNIGLTSAATATSADPNDETVWFWTGNAAGTATCSNWSTTAGSATRGAASATASNWLSRGASNCDLTRRLVCICWAGAQ